MISFMAKDGGVTFAVRVQPRASQSAISGETDGVLKVRLTAPPVDGAANEELIRLLARLFAVPRSQVAIISGATSRQKLVHIGGLTPEAIINRIGKENLNKAQIDLLS